MQRCDKYGMKLLEVPVPSRDQIKGLKDTVAKGEVGVAKVFIALFLTNFVWHTVYS